MGFNLFLLLALGAFAVGSGKRPKTENTGPISPGVDYPMIQNPGPISPGVDYPLIQNTGPISPGVDYPMYENTGPISPGADYPIPQNQGAVLNSPASNYRPVYNAPVSNGPAYNGPAYNGPVSNVPRCNKNEVYQTCGVGWQCENYCGREPSACAAYCQDGCYCEKGYIRSGPEYTAGCIKENQCPRCSKNEVYQTCGVGWQCEDYCGKEPSACAAYCEDGCYCKKGYTREGPAYTAKCIPENQCPRAQNNAPKPVQSASPRCNKNEVYQNCGVGWQCEDYCGKEPSACAAYCQDGCYCKKGYIREGPEYTAGCIKENQCPRAQKGPGGEKTGDGPQYENEGSKKNFGPGPVKLPLKSQNSGPPKCKINEEYKECNGCDQICGRKPIACKQDCSSPGCYCRKNFVRDAKKDVCIPKKHC